MIYNESPRRKQITTFVNWGHWFALANIIIAIVISSVYMLSSPSPVSFLSSVYLLITWLGHTAFIIFFGFILLVLPLCYQVSNARVLKTISSSVAALALALLAFDALLYNKTGFHLSWHSTELLKSETQGQVSAFGWLQWFYLGLLFVVWLMFQLVLANAIFKRIARFQKIHIGQYVTSAFVACFIGSHAIHVWADAKLYTPILEQDNMFPLSYPTTAKNLMSRAGLLDLQDYKTRQDLQFSNDNVAIRYPNQPVYCSVDASQKVLVLSVRDTAINQLPENVVDHGYHFVSQSIQNNYLAALLYSMPPALLSTLPSAAPVALALPNAFDVNIALYQKEALSDDAHNAFLSPYALPWDGFLGALHTQASGMYIADITNDELAQINMPKLLLNTKVFMIAKQDDKANYHLFSNQPIAAGLSSTEDLVPTMLNSMGCNAPAQHYSSGQFLQKPSRTWLVSTQGANLVVIKDGLLTQVSADGSFEVIDYNNNEKVLVELDTNLLSRAIKHLNQFSK